MINMEGFSMTEVLITLFIVCVLSLALCTNQGQLKGSLKILSRKWQTSLTIFNGNEQSPVLTITY